MHLPGAVKEAGAITVREAQGRADERHLRAAFHELAEKGHAGVRLRRGRHLVVIVEASPERLGGLCQRLDVTVDEQDDRIACRGAWRLVHERAPSTVGAT